VQLGQRIIALHVVSNVRVTLFVNILVVFVCVLKVLYYWIQVYVYICWQSQVRCNLLSVL
jgi:hypothetical protein